MKHPDHWPWLLAAALLGFAGHAQATDTPATTDEPAATWADQTRRLLDTTGQHGLELWQRSRETATHWWQDASAFWRPDPDAASSAQRDTLKRLWPELLPTLEETLALRDIQRDLPEQAWFKRDQRTVEQEIQALLDQAVAVLSMSPLRDERARIAQLHAKIDQARARIAADRQERVAAPTQSLVQRTRTDYDQRIAAEQQAINDYQAQLQQIQGDFAAQLREIGLDLSDEQVEFLLSTVVGDTMIDLGIVFDNVKQITVELERLVNDSGEDMSSARRYYGLYVVLLRALRQMHLDVEQTIEADYLPRIDAIRTRAHELSRETRQLLTAQPERATLLRANLDAQAMTLDAAQRYRDYLAGQARQVRRARQTLERDIRTAWNTYETVRVSGELIALVQSSQQLLNGLLEHQAPPLRPFENRQMKREFEQLTAQLRAAQG